MQLTIKALYDDIIKKYGKEYWSDYLGIEQTSYLHNSNCLVVQVCHYKDRNTDRVYKLTFTKVELCRITEERYMHEFEEEILEGFSFLWLIKNSRLKKDFNSWSTYEGIFGPKQYEKLKLYRVTGQNNFIDVLTTEEPVIELLGI